MDRKEALEKAARTFWTVAMSNETLEAFETLIPEFEGCRDEIIRKALVDRFSSEPKKYFIGGLTNEDIVDYLNRNAVKPVERSKESDGEEPEEADTGRNFEFEEELEYWFVQVLYRYEAIGCAESRIREVAMELSGRASESLIPLATRKNGGGK